MAKVQVKTCRITGQSVADLVTYNQRLDRIGKRRTASASPFVDETEMRPLPKDAYPTIPLSSHYGSPRYDSHLFNEDDRENMNNALPLVDVEAPMTSQLYIG